MKRRRVCGWDGGSAVGSPYTCPAKRNLHQQTDGHTTMVGIENSVGVRHHHPERHVVRHAGLCSDLEYHVRCSTIMKQSLQECLSPPLHVDRTIAELTFSLERPFERPPHQRTFFLLKPIFKYSKHQHRPAEHIVQANVVFSQNF